VGSIHDLSSISIMKEERGEDRREELGVLRRGEVYIVKVR
jgi:hypothetical protein